MTLLAESDALHARVRAFAAEPGPNPRLRFEELGLDIARYQARNNPGFARLVAQRGSTLAHFDDIPAVPSDAFRLTRVATHGAELDAARFATSGTTGDERGVHSLRTTATYEALSLAFGRRALLAHARRHTVVAIASMPDEPTASSLGFMMSLFMRDWDGRALDEAAPFAVRSSERWLLGPDGVDVTGLERAARVAESRGEPLLVLATSFALVALLDELAGASLPLPAASVVMQTGGYKGRTREVPADELCTALSSTFRIPETHLVSEYGMTELSSQLYEGVLPGAELCAPRGVYLEPAWLRVIALDPATLTPVSEGERGLACFVDLANVDSAVAVVTRDLVRRRDAGIELLGRAPGAPPRGCSLAVEALLGG